MEKPEPISLHMRFMPAPSVVARELDGEAVLLDLASSSYFGLDAIGFHIWSALDGETQLANIVSQLEDEYEVEPEQLRRDVCALVHSLAEKGLVRITDLPMQS